MTAQNVRVVREYRFEGLVAPHPGQEEIGPVNAALILELANDADLGLGAPLPAGTLRVRSVEHTSELQSLMRISYAVFCFKKKKLQRLFIIAALYQIQVVVNLILVI